MKNMLISSPLSVNENNKDLSLIFAACCIIDLFGIFPIIALPRTIIDCGWFGIPLSIFIFFIQIYTAIMLGRCWIMAENLEKKITEKKRYPYSALMELTYGSIAGRMVNIILGLAVFGGCVPNLLIASQNLQLVGLKLSTYQFDFSYCYWLLFLGILCCPIMCLGSPKDLKWVGITSAFTVLISSILTWSCLVDINSDEVAEPIIPQTSWESILIAYGILAFQFDVHPMVLTIQMDMKNKNELGVTILLAFLVTGSLFLITTILCYTRYGTNIHYNTLQGLKPSSMLYMDIAIVSFQIVLSIVVGATPLFLYLEEALNINPGFGWKRCVLRSSIMILTVLLAEAIPRFDFIMGLIGGSLMGQLMFIYPPLIYTRLRSLQAKRFPHLPELLTKTYGTIGGYCNGLPNDNQALVLSVHRADLSMEDHPDDINRLERTSSSHIVRFIKRNSSCFDLFKLENVLDMGPLNRIEKITNIILIVLGVCASILSTYYTLNNLIDYVDFSPSCLTNITLASRFLYRDE